MAKRNRIKIQPLVTVITLSINIQKSGVEIRFPEDPGDEVREILTENGWRFNPYGATQTKWQDPCWYKKHTPENLKFARDLVKLLGGVDNTGPALAALAAVAQTTPAPVPPQTTPMAATPTIEPSVPMQLPVQSKAESASAQETVEIKVPALAA